ncbi:hypothetical protein [uncultured Eudoraea sp.]|uniref:hypothetical protein n=1 Tax=uncultured Eudoraea sp. TaxID=1035614 RepID=UPI0026229F13|nr:hypothetical protein [uncultured Eudoraea sp.]
MLRFFRQIRQNLLTENKFGKYLLYVIIEVFIVIIGILIAIRVDNRNEERIGAESTNILLQDVSDELVHNIENIDRILNTMIFKDSLFFEVLEKRIEHEDYEASSILFGFPAMYDRTSLVDEDFRELLARKNNLTKLQDSIFSELKDLYGKRKKNIDIDDETTHNTQIDFRDKMMNEQAWWSVYMENGLTEEMIQYALTDPFYRNQLHEIRFREYWRTMGLFWFRTKALNLYEEITEMLKIEKDTSLVKDIKDFEHIKGIYEYGEYKVHIIGKNEWKANFFKNDSMLQEWDIHPYSKSHLINYMQAKGEHIFSKIEYGRNGEVLGLVSFGDMTEVDGKRRMWKKIE